MRKILTIALTVIAFLLSGNSLTYAAFPLDAQNAPAVIVPDNNSNATISAMHKADEPEPKAATETHTRKTHKTQFLALILSFFVGVLGIHRFYLGYTWQGIVQLLTAGGLGIWALIDFIRIAANDLGPKKGPYDETIKQTFSDNN